MLADEGLSIYPCGREDIDTGQIDRRVLAMLEYLRSKGFEADDHRAEVRPRLPDHLRQRLRAHHRRRRRHRRDQRRPGHRPPGPGTLTDQLIKDVLQLQGTMHPHQVISLEDLPGETSFAMADHYDHVHVGYHADRNRQPARSAVGAAEPGPVAAPDRPARADRKPGSADRAVEVLGSRRDEEQNAARTAGGYRAGED